MADNLEFEKTEKKVALFGLDNAGKTSILLSLQKDTNLLSYYRLNPTRGVQRVSLEDLTNKIYIMDFGGQEQYRNEYLKDLKSFIVGADKLIYVFDIQDKERYNYALDYFDEILKTIIKEDIKLEMSIYFHKYDPDIESKDPKLVEKDIPELAKKLSEKIPKDMAYEVFKTSIFTMFQKTFYS